ncbi:hypothetical protein BJ912DRAFT_1046337 [Pholiota molesta]|nr:hypothetical protein BJ912DRAFT_1046337 [Pholiota molesta]
MADPACPTEQNGTLDTMKMASNAYLVPAIARCRAMQEEQTGNMGSTLSGVYSLEGMRGELCEILKTKYLERLALEELCAEFEAVEVIKIRISDRFTRALLPVSASPILDELDGSAHFWLTLMACICANVWDNPQCMRACVPLLSSGAISCSGGHPLQARMHTLRTSIRLSTKGGIAANVHLGGHRGLWAPDSSVKGAGGVASARGAPGSYRISCCSPLVWTSLVAIYSPSPLRAARERAVPYAFCKEMDIDIDHKAGSNNHSSTKCAPCFETQRVVLEDEKKGNTTAYPPFSHPPNSQTHDIVATGESARNTRTPVRAEASPRLDVCALGEGRVRHSACAREERAPRCYDPQCGLALGHGGKYIDNAATPANDVDEGNTHPREGPPCKIQGTRTPLDTSSLEFARISERARVSKRTLGDIMRRRACGTGSMEGYGA